ncbi:hypothetical protein K458DRAFT_121788 [Lentithecium fluviatile CBS 122367]|uniref:Uncharacterized protein n=1 Tax=Lentithecium fluviatile CBS 122367 TaxID=1168545 RepID=A0A6G1IL60_9PLEO|nr:hypothetical protein K458DRAFT_121788 [Lentithecium fluviatile CBS 122367]
MEYTSDRGIQSMCSMTALHASCSCRKPISLRRRAERKLTRPKVPTGRDRRLLTSTSCPLTPYRPSGLKHCQHHRASTEREYCTQYFLPICTSAPPLVVPATLTFSKPSIRNKQSRSQSRLIENPHSRSRRSTPTKRSLTLRRLNIKTTKLAGLYIHKFSFVRPLLGPKAWVYGGDYKKPP